jgi:hypothetical protein
MRLIPVILFILIQACAFGQSFVGDASLPKVDKDGFYRIGISPEISTHANSTFSNIRIIDSQNKEVPYLFEKEYPAYFTKVFKEYEVVEKKQQKNCCTSLILKNPYNQPINNIHLSIKNAEVTKQATLLGSDDRENWFALKEYFVLNSINSTHSTSEIKIVDFPLSNYAYYILKINDSTSAPINILKAGYYEVLSEDGKYTEIPVKAIKSDSAQEKRSYVHIKFDTLKVIDKLTFTMSGAPHFLRKATLLQKMERPKKKGGVEIYYEELATTTVSSKQSTVIELPGIKSDALVVVIENEDNPSLNISSVNAFQLNRYLTAWMKKDEHYTLKLADVNTSAPVYDLEFFRDSIPDQPQVLASGPVTIYPEKKISESPTLFTSRLIIWGAIIIVIIVLGFMAVKMINEASVKE